jgi:hypothetical protein
MITNSTNAKVILSNLRGSISRTIQYTSNYLGQLEAIEFDDGEVRVRGG